MIRLADYVIDFLVKKGIEDIFLVSGGGIMYLLDAVGRNKKMRYISQYHEQACAMAAEAYARLRNHISACLVTTGPGSTNAVTGVAGAWVESIPMIVISGQIKRETIADYSRMRQLGLQEINIVDIVQPITKYAKTIMQPETITYELEKAFYEATAGRPGPVWINIPLDVQGAMIDETKLKHYHLTPKNQNYKKSLKKAVKETIEMLKKAKRPVLIAGFGIRLAHAEKLLKELIVKLKAPVLVSNNSLDLMSENHPLFMGRYGPAGQRKANFVLQTADLVLSIGASLNVTSTGFNFKGFAPKAKKIMVNIDQGELCRPTLKIDFPIQADAKDFMEELLSKMKNSTFKFSHRWYEACRIWKKRYPTIVSDFFKNKKHVNSYVFMDKLSDLLTTKDVLVTGIGLDVVSFYQAFKVKKNQRAFCNKNNGNMGYCLPGSIGACVGNERKRTVLVTGDGSIQFNIQELNTIKYYKLPIKIFIFNNKGYKSIRDTQNNLFEGRLVGADEHSGVTNPDFKKLAGTYNFSYGYILNNQEIDKRIKEALRIPGPTLYEVNIAYDQVRMPRVVSYRRPDGTLESKPLEDMSPFLPTEEIYKNMHMFD